MNVDRYQFPDLLPLLGSVGLAILLGAVIGYDREHRDKPAGLRTHALVAVASAIAMMVATAMDGTDNNDGIRGVNAVMTGIGFLGAGAIMRRGEIVYGIKTGATIWTAGATGLAVGVGWYAAAVSLSVSVVVILAGLRVVENWLPEQTQVVALQMDLPRDKPFPTELIEKLRELRFEVLSVKMGDLDEGDTTSAEIVTQSPVDFVPEVAASIMQGSDLVSNVRYEIRE